MLSSFCRQIAALLGGFAVLLGAFGAHALKSILEAHQSVATWHTASHYHLIHSVVLLWVSSQKEGGSIPFVAFTAGIILFSGSLYLLAVTGMHWLGLLTPFGGLALIIGWLSLMRPSQKEERR